MYNRICPEICKSNWVKNWRKYSTQRKQGPNCRRKQLIISFWKSRFEWLASHSREFKLFWWFPTHSPENLSQSQEVYLWRGIFPIVFSWPSALHQPWSPTTSGYWSWLLWHFYRDLSFKQYPSLDERPEVQLFSIRMRSPRTTLLWPEKEKVKCCFRWVIKAIKEIRSSIKNCDLGTWNIFWTQPMYWEYF